MAVTVRDVVLVLRAKDEASQTIRGVATAFGTIGSESYLAGQRMIAAGGALLGLGAAMGSIGVGFLGLTKQFIQTSLDYQQQAGLTLTQVDELGVSLDDIKNIGRDVARTVPVPFDQVQEGLYQIFSSMDVTSEEAGKILEAFSKGAVAGQVDLQTAGAATIGIMNAFGLGIEDLGRVQDVQFQLVRKGVGTYEDFATSIGLALPSAVRAGQDIEHLSGMIAFLTRNGLSASRASTSAARALDLLSNPTTVKRLEKMGITVKNDKGEFLDINTIVTQLGYKLKDLTAPQRAAALQELFKGAGNNIQARRFWDTALANYDEFNQRTTEMMNAAGVADDAYDIMFNQPLSQIDLLKNKWHVLASVLGDFLVPKLMDVVEWGQKVLDWLLNLSPETQKWIAYGITLAGIFFTISGVLAGLAGTFLIFAGAIKMAGGIANLIGVLGGYFLILLLIAGAAYLIYKNWDKIKPLWDKYWPGVKAKAEAFLNWLKDTWDQYWPGIKEALIEFWGWSKAKWQEYWPIIRQAVEDFLSWLWMKWQEYWPQIKQFLSDTLDAIQEAWEYVWPRLKEAVQDIIEWFQTNWPTIKQTFMDVKDAVIGAIDYLVEHFDEFWNKAQDVYGWFKETFAPGLKDIWESIQENIVPIIIDIKDILLKAWQVIKYISETVWPYLRDLIIGAMRAALVVIDGTWQMIAGIFSGGLEMIRGILDIIAGLLTGDWSRMWDGAKHVVEGFIQATVGLISGFWTILWGLFRVGVALALALFVDLKDDIIRKCGELLTWLITLGGRVKAAIGDWSRLLWNTGASLIQGLWNGAKDKWNDFTGWLKSLNPAPHFNDINLRKGHAAVNLLPVGVAVMEGLQRGMKIGWNDTTDWLSTLNPAASMTPIAQGRGSTSITIASGAVQLSVGSVRDDSDLDRIEKVVDNKFSELLRELSQPSYRSTYG